MPKNKQNNQAIKSNEVFEGVMGGLREARDFLSGKSVKCKIHYPVDIKNIRKKQNLSQIKFANAFGFSIDTLRNWEQGKRVPDKSAQILLSVIDSYPDIVREVVDSF